MPDVVDSDEDRNDVGLKRDAVGIQSVEKLGGAVAADAEVDELNIGLGERLSDIFCGELGITRAELVIVSLISARVSYAVALEQYLHFLTLRSRPQLRRKLQLRCTHRCRCA